MSRCGCAATTRGKHLDGSDRRCSKAVLDLVWSEHVQKHLKNRGGLGLTELWTAARTLIRPLVLEPEPDSSDRGESEEDEQGGGGEGGVDAPPVVLSASGRVSLKVGEVVHSSKRVQRLNAVLPPPTAI